MLLESLLAYAHFVAILSVVVFVTSEAALCRVEWLNAAVVHRLAVCPRAVAVPELRPPGVQLVAALDATRALVHRNPPHSHRM